MQHGTSSIALRAVHKIKGQNYNTKVTWECHIMFKEAPVKKPLFFDSTKLLKSHRVFQSWSSSATSYLLENNCNSHLLKNTIVQGRMCTVCLLFWQSSVMDLPARKHHACSLKNPPSNSFFKQIPKWEFAKFIPPAQNWEHLIRWGEVRGKHFFPSEEKAIFQRTRHGG